MFYIGDEMKKKVTKKNALKKNKKSVVKNDWSGQTYNFSGQPFTDPSGFAGLGANPFAPQISQANVIFDNLRYYLVSNFRQVLSQAYVEIGLIQTIVDVPVDDALRGGIEIISKQLSEDQIKELALSVDRDDDLTTVGQACKWNRLFGGAGIMILIDEQDPELPLDLKSIHKDSDLEFRAVDMWELFWDKQNTDGYDPTLQSTDFEFYNYYAEQVHKTRVMRLKGLVAPSFIRPRLRGWGFSVVEILIRSINQYLKATDVAFEILDEAKIDVYKIKNLVNTLLNPNAQNIIQNRVQQANQTKNYQNAIVMDSEDDYAQKSLSFSGLAETMQQIRMQVAADMRMPITKLFGTSASAGIGNTDQNDMENYNSMVESQVRNKIKWDLLRMLEIKCQKLFGLIPDDLEIKFKPLAVLTAEQEENVKNSKFNRLLSARQAGEIDSSTFRDAINKENLLGVQLDDTDALLNPSNPEVGEVVEEDPENDPLDTKDVDDPGANRADTRKPKAWDYSLKEIKNKSQFPETGALQALQPASNEPNEFFDIVAYEKDGGDTWLNKNELLDFNHPIDSQLWLKAKEDSKKYLNVNNPKYIIWNYRKNGGRFDDPESSVKMEYNAKFDSISYRQDGGDDWITKQQMKFFEHPIDQKLWEKAKIASMRFLKSDNPKYKIWYYRKNGGDFSPEPILNSFELRPTDLKYSENFLIRDKDKNKIPGLGIHTGNDSDEPIDEAVWQKAKEEIKKETGDLNEELILKRYQKLKGLK